MPKKTKAKRPIKSVLRLPDLDHSKTSVLQSLGSVASKRTYTYAINDFITWYCSEPRLAFGRTVVLRYRYELEARRLAPATINLRLAAVRRLAVTLTSLPRLPIRETLFAIRPQHRSCPFNPLQLWCPFRNGSRRNQSTGAVGLKLHSTIAHCSFAYSALACLRIGMSGSASLQSVRKSW
jgi:hypothetical protein